MFGKVRVANGFGLALHFEMVVLGCFGRYQPFDLLLVGTIPFGLAFFEIPKLFVQGKAERNVFAFAVFRNSEH